MINPRIYSLLLVSLGLACSAVHTPVLGQQQLVPQPPAQPGLGLKPLETPLEIQPTESDSAPPAAPVQLVDAEMEIKSETTKQALQAKQHEVASKLRVALLQEQAQKAVASDAAPKASETEVDLLKQIDVIIAQQKAASATLADVETAETEATTERSRIEIGQLAEEPPYSITLVDRIRDSIESLQAKSEALQASLQAAQEAVEQARKVVEDTNRAARQFKENNPDGDAKIVDLDARVSEELLVLRRQELAIAQASERVRSIKLEIAEAKIGLIGDQVTFSKEMLDKQINELDSRELELKRKAESLQREVQYAERRWMTSRQELDATPTPSADLLERVEALKSSEQALQQALNVTNQRLQRLPMIRTAWERRYLVVQGAATHRERRDWLAETIKQLEQLSRERRARQLKIEEVRGTALGVNAKIEATPAGDSELRRWLELQQTSLNKQSETLANGILAIDTAMRTLDRLQFQIEGEKGRTLAEWIADSWNYLNGIWNYELAHTEDASITVGEVLSSLLLLFIGFFAARWISSLLARRLPKWGIDEAGVSVIETLSFYILLIAFGLAALRYANVPLTVFTFLGGAIAIGVGFGSQNIINNFISGLILLAERPIKKGDLIHLDEMYGNVVKIGARSTMIRTGENLDIIVPNSKFLENNVTNLTRRDDRLRTSIAVGVAYGSPLDQVVGLLKQAASQSADVQDRPEPMVWFIDFGDNSLIFQINFWIKAKTLAQMRKIETEVRLNIDRLYREHGIVIAFPQRDLHIQTPRPIELRLTGSDGADDLPVRAAG